jgi:hypothetical protein
VFFSRTSKQWKSAAKFFFCILRVSRGLVVELGLVRRIARIAKLTINFFFCKAASEFGLRWQETLMDSFSHVRLFDSRLDETDGCAATLKSSCKEN